MLGSIRAFFSQIIDYAGLFPPAQLPFGEAFRNYTDYQSSPDAWLLGRFVCPASRLAEFETSGAIDLLHSGTPVCRLSILGRGGNSVAEFLAGVRQDVADLDRFQILHLDQFRFEVYEAALPAALAVDCSRFADLHAGTCDTLPEANVQVFYEVGPTFTAEAIGAIAKELAAANRRDGVAAGLKLRCGGRDASAIPPPRRVADVIAIARQVGVPLKFTAGLHHPLRHMDPTLQVPMHGFVNVFVAGMLAADKHWSADQLLPVIETESASDFRFYAEELRWRDEAVSVAAIEKARRNRVTSFGSCSFDEPRNDLRQLGWL